MASKPVSQLDPDGYYVGETLADESPLEPGVWHIPGGAIDVPAPQTPEGHRAKWLNNDWIFEEIPPPPEPYVPTAQDKMNLCKVMVKGMLIESDYTQALDVKDKLVNYDDFVSYRAQLRDLYFNPVEEPVFPTPPDPVWVS